MSRAGLGAGSACVETICSALPSASGEASTDVTTREYGTAVDGLERQGRWKIVFGRAHVPLGAYDGDEGKPERTPFKAQEWTNQAKGWYVEHLLDRFPSHVQNSLQVPSAVDVMRRALASAANGSVTVVAIGFATNLHALLLSAPDQHSVLDGALTGRVRPSRARDLSLSLSDGMAHGSSVFEACVLRVLALRGTQAWNS